MQGAFVYIIAIVAFVITLNFVMLFIRLRRDKYRKPSRETLEEAKAAELRDREIKRRLNREEEDALHQVELRNKTLDLYMAVRRRAAEREREATENQESAGETNEDDSETIGLWTGGWGHSSDD